MRLQRAFCLLLIPAALIALQLLSVVSDLQIDLFHLKSTIANINANANANATTPISPTISLGKIPASTPPPPPTTTTTATQAEEVVSTIASPTPGESQSSPPKESVDPEPVVISTPEPEPAPIGPPAVVYKPTADATPEPIVDNFPRAAAAKSHKDLPPVPSWNRPPKKHVPEKTPLFIGFTRNWRLLQQTVVSYITAGWPPEDIYVVDNSGTMNSNKLGKLSLQNPFYLDYNRLTKIYRINVLTTPTLLSFAQLQNYYITTATDLGWTYYFWSHMDVVAISYEDREPYRSLYLRAVDGLREALAPGFAVDDQGREGRWGTRFYSFDRLTLINVEAYVDAGGWDTMIPYYNTDCDMYFRLERSGWKTAPTEAGEVFDLAESLQDLEVLYRKKLVEVKAINGTQERIETHPSEEEDTKDSEQYKNLWEELSLIQNSKLSDSRGRNTWQARQGGGQGEPFYRDPQVRTFPSPKTQISHSLTNLPGLRTHHRFNNRPWQAHLRREMGPPGMRPRVYGAPARGRLARRARLALRREGIFWSSLI
jgi:hypothetical protein